MTLEAIRHIELRESSVREWVQDKPIKVLHVAGKDNINDIFTKEMRDVCSTFLSAEGFIHASACWFQPGFQGGKHSDCFLVLIVSTRRPHLLFFVLKGQNTTTHFIFNFYTTVVISHQTLR